jgi:hypothetical protein
VEKSSRIERRTNKSAVSVPLNPPFAINNSDAVGWACIGRSIDAGLLAVMNESEVEVRGAHRFENHERRRKRWITSCGENQVGSAPVVKSFAV